MAFSTLTASVTNIAALDDLPNDTGGLSADELKQEFDKAGVDIKEFINDVHLPELEATTVNNSGASKVGVESIPGIVGNDVQTVLESLVAAGAGGIPPDGSISNAKLATDVKVGSLASITATTTTASVTSVINELISKIPTTILTTRGDMLYKGSSSVTRLPVSAAYTNLSVNSAGTEPTYQASLQSLMTGTGSIIICQSPHVPIELGAGAAYKSLNMNSAGTVPAWSESLQSLMTDTGDILYASNNNTPARLAKGTAGQVLTINSGATAPEWANPDWVKIASTTLGANANKVDFTSVPFSSYNLLRITFNGNGGNGAPDLTIRLNDITDNDYSYKYFTQATATTIGGAVGSGVGYGKVCELNNDSSFLNKVFSEIIFKAHVYSSSSAQLFCNAITYGGNGNYTTYSSFQFTKSNTTLDKISIFSSNGTSYYFAGTKIELWGANV